jgi:hypothetical protein
MRKLIAMSLLTFFGLAQGAEYSVGQVWTYKTRAGEKQSTVLINKIENHEKLGRIFHISIDRVKIKNWRVTGGIQTDMPHVPVSEKTLKMSLTKLVDNKAINSEYLKGYNEWKLDFDKEKAGIFTTSIADIVAIVEEATSKK